MTITSMSTTERPGLIELTPAAPARPHAPAPRWNLQARASPGVRGRDLDWTWLVALADVPLGLVPTALLAVLIDRKAQREETWLIERFPDYALYRARTPRRFLPWLY